MDPRLEELLRMIRRSDDGDGDNESSESEEASGSDCSSSSSVSSVSSEQNHSNIDRSFSALKRQLNVFLEEPPRPFRPGDVVMWKEGCSNRKRPKLDEPCVVLEVLDEPIYGAEYVLYLYSSNFALLFSCSCCV